MSSRCLWVGVAKAAIYFLNGRGRAMSIMSVTRQPLRRPATPLEGNSIYGPCVAAAGGLVIYLKERDGSRSLVPLVGFSCAGIGTIRSRH